MDKNWHPLDFIKSGKTCDLQTIRGCLQQLVEKTGATRALLVASHGNHCFRSLMLLCDSSISQTKDQSRAVERDVLDYLASSSGTNDHVDEFLLAVADSRLEEMKLRMLLNTDSFRCRSFLDRLTRGLKKELKVFSASSKSRDSDAADSREATAAVLCFGGSRSKLRSKTLEKLHLMVNASSPVVFRSYSRRRESLDTRLLQIHSGYHDALQASGSRLFDRQTQQAIQQYADVAREQTGSDLVVVFWHGKDASTSKRPAERQKQKDKDSALFFDIKALSPVASKVEKDVLRKASARLLGYCCRRLRAIVINNFSSEHGFYSFTADGQPLKELFPDIRCLAAIPIYVDAFATDTGEGQRCLGVMLATKISEEDREPFDISSVTTLSTVCDRISLLHKVSISTATTKTLHDVLSQETDGSLGQPRTPGGRNTMQLGAFSLLPRDLLAAAERIQPSLELAHRLTNSASVTLRLATTDGARLIRVAAYPRERMNDALPSIKVADHFVHSRVAREGESVHIPDTTTEASVQSFAGPGVKFGLARQTRSQHCVPVFVGSRLAGAINFESKHRRGLDESYWYIRAFAAQVSTILVEARRSSENKAFEFASRLLIKSHTLLHCQDALKRALEANPREDVRDHVDSAFQDLETVLNADRNVTIHAHPKTDGSGITVGALVSTVLEKARHPSWDFEHRFQKSQVSCDLQDVSHHRIRDPVRAAAEIALSTVVDNVKHHAPNIRPAQLTCHDGKLGGKAFVRFYVASPANSRLPPAVLNAIFRQPVIAKPNGTPRLGAFIAGLLLRSIGGEASVIKNGDNTIGILLDVPVDCD